MKLPVEQTIGIDGKRIIANNREAIRKISAQFGKRRKASFVSFYRCDICTSLQQRLGQSAGTWPDFKNLAVLQIARNGCNSTQKLRVEQEVLTERFARGQSVLLDNLS